MGSFYSVLGKTLQPPNLPHTDQVQDSYDWDNAQTLRDQSISITLLFQQVLDADKLHTSLLELIGREGWRRIGGRLRLDSSGRIQIYVPATFTPQRPPFQFETAHHNVSIYEHPFGSALTSTTDLNRPSLHAGFNYFQSALARVSRTFNDYLTQDIAPLDIHVVTFNDATIISLSWPHAAWDMMSMSGILSAWIAVLNGSIDKVPPVANKNRDPMRELEVSEVRQPFYLYSEVLACLSAFRFVGRVLWEGLWGWNDSRPIVLSIPSTYITSLRFSALKSPSSHQEDVPFLSDGDLITIWLTRLSRNAITSSTRRNITILSFFDLRAQQPHIFCPPRLYIQNAAFPLHYRLDSLTALHLDTGLDRVARSIRQAIINQTTPEQIAANARFGHNMVQQTDNLPAYGKSDSYTIIISNWDKSKFFEMDFSGAIVQDRGRKDSSNSFGRPVCVHGWPFGFPSVLTCWCVLGKNSDRNLWVTGTPRGLTTDMINREITI